MAYGLRITNNGIVQVDTTTSMGRIIGSVATGAVDGSIHVPQFADGIPFFQSLLFSDIGAFNFPVTMRYPTVSINGHTLSWWYQPDDPGAFSNPARCHANIFYGIR